MIIPARSERVANNGAKGCDSVRTTVFASGASTFVTCWISLRRGDAVAWSSIRSKLILTASALKGVPSWKVAPSTRVKV